MSAHLETISRLFPDDMRARTGSREICTPPPIGTDEDWIVHVLSLTDAIKKLSAEGFQTTTDQDYEGTQSDFQSWKKEELNILVTEDAGFFAKFVAATSIAKRLNLLSKDDRIALFRAVLYAEACWMRDAA